MEAEAASSTTSSSHLAVQRDGEEWAMSWQGLDQTVISSHLFFICLFLSPFFVFSLCSERLYADFQGDCYKPVLHTEEIALYQIWGSRQLNPSNLVH